MKTLISTQYLRILVSLMVMCVSPILANQAQLPIRFSSITSHEGLSQNTIFDIVQDEIGNLWIATADGLNKYDGYRFTVYRHDDQDENSLQADFVKCLLINKQQELFVGTRFGFSIYDTRKNKFDNYSIDEQVNNIAQLNDSLYYIIAISGIYEFDYTSKKLKEIIQDKSIDFQSVNKYNNQLLIGTNKGLFVLQPDAHQLVPYNEELQNKSIQDICTTPDALWVATEGGGLYRIKHTGEIINYKVNTNKNIGLSSNFVRSLRLDAHNKLWIGTFLGLDVLDLSTNKLEHYYSSDIERGTINQNSVRSIFLDNQGGMWIGTFFGGLNYYHPLQNQFGKIKHLPYGNTLNDNVTSCIVEGDGGELWIGTNDKGLNRYNTKNKSFTYYTTGQGANSILSNNIKAVLVDGNYVYIGSHSGGMARLNKQNNRITNFTAKNSELLSDNVYALVKDAKGLIWVGTLNGLTIFDPKTEKFLPFSSSHPIGDMATIKDLATKSIFTLYRDSKNRIWIGTEIGVYSYSLNNKLLASYEQSKTDRSARINCFLEDENQHIWVGSNSGLYLLNEGSQRFKVYKTKDGLPNNNILGILRDSCNRLWVSTYSGLASFTPATEKVRTYTLIDGIQTDQFNSYSYCKTSSGEMYFGGINGITHFFPEQLIDNPFAPNAVISQLNLFNTRVLPGDDTGILQCDISNTSHIRLKPNQTSFSLVFTVPNFLSAKHNTFAYKLEGVDLDWNYMSEIHPVSYSNLEHGRYTFYVKAANSDGKWSDTATVLEIEIAPHWWQTIWAKLLFGILFLLMIYYIIRFFNHKQMLRNQLALEHIEKEKTEEVNQMKLRFFINISHEFRTPLTLIISPLQELHNNSTGKWERDQIKIMQRNTNKLLYLVDQLMDYRRAELGVFGLKVESRSPVLQVQDLMNMFERLAKQKNVDFTFENYLGDKGMLYDLNYFDFILSNLLSNAFKFTPEGGCIGIKIFAVDDYVVLEVSDTGKGMKKEVLDKIFERFYQVSSEDKGTGIGLSLVQRLVDLHHGRVEVESELSQGAKFKVYFPQDESLYSADEKAETGESVRHKNLSSETINLMLEPREVEPQSESEGQKLTILVVEDDADVRNYLVSNLTDIGNVEKAENGEEALKIIKEKEIDIIITDLMLPIMDGVRLCKTVKQNIRTSHIPVIMLTAKTNQQDQLDGLVAGADDYIHKPFSISILKMKVQNMLKSRARMLEHYSNTLEVEPEKIAFNEMDKEFLENAKKIVLDNLDNISFSVDDFCKDMAMSRSNLHLKMKAITGESTIEFIKKIRFNEACNLLKDGRYSISDISTMVGFNTPSYFTISFKKYFNMLPTDYAKSFKSNG